MNTLRKQDRPNVWTFIKILLALFLAGVLVSQVDFSQLPELMRSVSYKLVGLSFVLFVAMTMMKACQYHLLLDDRLSYFDVLNVVIVQNALSNLLAMGAGVASYLAMLQGEHGVKVSRSAAVFLLTKIGDLTTVWLLVLVSGLLLWDELGGLQILVIGTLSLIGLLLLFFFSALVFRQYFLKFLSQVAHVFRLDHYSAIQKVLEILSAFANTEERSLTKKTGKVMTSSLVYGLLTMAFAYVNLRLFNAPVSVSAAVFVNSLLQLLSYIPVQVLGGLGVVEAGSLYLYTALKVTPPGLTVALLGNRLLFYLFNGLMLIYPPLQGMLSKNRRKI